VNDVDVLAAEGAVSQINTSGYIRKFSEVLFLRQADVFKWVYV